MFFIWVFVHGRVALLTISIFDCDK